MFRSNLLFALCALTLFFAALSAAGPVQRSSNDNDYPVSKNSGVHDSKGNKDHSSKDNKLHDNPRDKQHDLEDNKHHNSKHHHHQSAKPTNHHGATPTNHNGVKQVSDFNFKPSSANTIDCPRSGGTQFTGPNGGKWGILCGWDTHSTEYNWAPMIELTFQDCLRECAMESECTVATYTGTCCLKKGAKGKGFVRTGSADDMTAIKLSPPSPVGGGNGKDGNGKEGQGKKGEGKKGEGKKGEGKKGEGKKGEGKKAEGKKAQGKTGDQDGKKEHRKSRNGD